MKKLHLKTQQLLKTHPKVSMLFMALIAIIGGVGQITSKLRLLSFASIFSSVYAIFRLFTHKFGIIPIFMTDTLWSKCRIEYSKEEAEDKYKDKSLKSAATCTIIGVTMHAVWVTCEFVLLLVNLF